MIKTKLSRKKLILAAAMLPFLLLSAQAFGQTARLSGTVMDASQAVLPGATVTATNNATNVKQTVTTNNAGVYNFASLPPGTYAVTAEMPGFQTMKRTDVTLEVGGTATLNFQLEVSGVATQIEVSTSAQDVLLESSSSTGQVMNDKTVKELPLVGNDIMQLINTMGGVVKDYDTVFGNSNQTFAGVMANDLNITRDGITVSDVRFGSGIVSPGRINPEMVGEFKLILSPVDAEVGRGAGQIQVLTKSGGNEYHGSGVWSVINTALDANEWNNNRTGTVPPWMNANEYTISVGGPIIKNKTFFFATWDQNIVRQKVTVTPNVLTPCARKGIYRWFATDPNNAPSLPNGNPITGWINGNSNGAWNTTSATATTRPVVDQDTGAPIYTYDLNDLNGTTYTDQLQYQSLFGQLTQTARDQINADPINCSQFDFSPSNVGVVAGSAWNDDRDHYDTSGYVEKFTDIMPMPNYYGAGDGLNTGGHRWTRTMMGQDTVYGAGMNSQRKSITIKIDHNINDANRLSGTWSYESSFSSSAEAVWPAPYGYGGAQDRKPQTFTATLTSTLRPTLLNEFRFGLSYNESHNVEPYNSAATGSELKALMNSLLPTDTGNFPQWEGLPLLIRPGNSTGRFDTGSSNPIGGRWNVEGTWGSNDWRWTFGDTITWTRGAHSFKGGTEIRVTKANSDMNGTTTSVNTYPIITGGNTQYSLPWNSITTKGDFGPGVIGTDNNGGGAYGSIYGLLNYFAGSVSTIQQYYFTNKPDQTTWSVPSTDEGLVRRIAMNQNEYSFFFKDDWKVSSDLTLNLGVRYEYYGVPHVKNGMTVGIVGGPLGLWGGDSGNYTTWLQNVNWNENNDPNFQFDFNFDNLTKLQFIGPDSPNPDQILIDKDTNNIAPAVGFAWQLPWFGKGKTTLRGGYQISYLTISRLDPNYGLMGASGSSPGTVFTDTYSGDSTNQPYMDLGMLGTLVPTSRFWDENTPQPLQTRLVTDGGSAMTALDQHIQSPYVQSLTMALTRNIGSSLTVDVRYIGTLSRKGIAQVNLNQNNWIANGLKDELDIVRMGGESAMINAMVPPGTLNYTFNPFASGSQQLRLSSSTQTDIAQGDYNTIATFLATDNGAIPNVGSNVTGQILRNTGLFPENFIHTNPQFSTATYWSNQNISNYHSMQAQVTLRPTHGLNFQATYTWSRAMGQGTVADPLNRAADYMLLGSHRLHSLTTYGTYNLPFGANGFVFRDSPGWVRKIVEGWQLSWVSSLTSGIPASVTGQSMLWGGSLPDLVRPDLFDTKGGHVTWEPGARSGRYFGDLYTRVSDPQCDALPDDPLSFFSPASMQSVCQGNLYALALASDPSVIVFQHPLPGVRGNFRGNEITDPGRWGLDLAMSKNIEFMEGKSINFRMDATNIFNHPTPSGGNGTSQNGRDYSVSSPNTGLNNTGSYFGYLGGKAGHRVFSAKIRISF